MTDAEVARRRWVAQEIARDAERDAMNLDRVVFTGGGVGPLFGEIYATLQALAHLVDELYAEAHPGIEPNEAP
jgi:hypothetical protein